MLYENGRIFEINIYCTGGTANELFLIRTNTFHMPFRMVASLGGPNVGTFTLKRVVTASGGLINLFLHQIADNSNCVIGITTNIFPSVVRNT